MLRTGPFINRSDSQYHINHHSAITADYYFEFKLISNWRKCRGKKSLAGKKKQTFIHHRNIRRILQLQHSP